MRAWQAEKFGEPLEVLALVETAKPSPRAAEVLIEVRSVGLGLPDLMAIRGEYSAITKSPVIPGHSLVGIIAESGPDSTFDTGDRVMARSMFRNGTGALADYAVAREFEVFPAPQFLSDEQAAGFVVPYHTAHVGISARGKIQAGETLLVLGGSGGSGAAAIQLGKALGATVIAAARGQTKTDFCLSQGADHVIDATARHIGDAARDLTGGRGVDIIFDPVGGAYCEQALEAMNRGGRLVLVGFAQGWPTLDAYHIVMRQYSVIGASVPLRSDAEREEASHTLEMLASAGKIAVPIESVTSFEHAPEIIAKLGGNVLGKHIVNVI